VSLRLEMLQVARLCPRLLSEGTDLVRRFVLNQQHPDGGFRDRAGNSDLYYTVFGTSCLRALQMDLPENGLAAYLDAFGDGEGLDLVHLCALARCWANLDAGLPDRSSAILDRVERYRSPDGGYGVAPGAGRGSAYGSFLALGAYQDLGRLPPEPEDLVRQCLGLIARDGGFSNEPGQAISLTPATAAAESILRTLGEGAPSSAADWLLGMIGPEGGFFAVPSAPMPDLLSTATALHALSGMACSIQPLREACLDFVDSLWVNRGGFYGNWADEHLDLEYTFYGLLALGHLAV